jgi:hypothetical protein
MRLAINLETCSEKDRKKAIKLAKSAGGSFFDLDRFKDYNWKYLIIYNDYDLQYSTMRSKSMVISLPQDWDKLYKFLGLEMPEEGLEDGYYWGENENGWELLVYEGGKWYYCTHLIEVEHPEGEVVKINKPEKL